MAGVENINPEILTWARETAGLSLDDAAESVGFSASARGSAAEKLEELEKGVRAPTRTQLQRIASVYRRPLITFYLRQPPARGPRGEDFRTSTADVSSREDGMLDALLRDIRARQEMVRAILEDEDEAKPLPFVGSLTMDAGVLQVAGAIRSELGFANHKSRRNTAVEEIFRDLRSKAEDAGLFVLLIGDLGSHHTAISGDVFRGFTIADRVAPFVVINDQDARSARPFTLLHELAHVWLGQTGVSGTSGAEETPSRAGNVERFCDDVASEVLLPESEFLGGLPDFEGELRSVQKQISDLAGEWSVSEPAVAYRLHRLGRLPKSMHRQLQSAYAARWMALKAKARDDAKETEGGPSFYTVKQFKLGKALLDVVRRSVRSDELSYTRAAKLLNVKTSTVEPMLRHFEKSATSRRAGD